MIVNTYKKVDPKFRKTGKFAVHPTAWRENEPKLYLVDASCCLHVASCTALVCFLLHPCAQATVYHGFIINFYYYVHSFTGGVGKENMRSDLAPFASFSR